MMSKFKNLTILAASALLTIFALTACGAQPASTPTSNPTPTSARGGGTLQLSPAELKYALLDKYANAGNLLYCDPDGFPISVAPDEEQRRADAKLPELQSDTEIYNAILRRNNLAGAAELTADQKLLVYRDSKKFNAIKLKPSGKDYKFSIAAGDAPGVEGSGGAGVRYGGLIDQFGSVLEETKEDAIVECPICLAGDTLIDAPDGPARVKDLQKGMKVWSLDPYGIRRVETVRKTAKRAVTTPHEMVHITLADGRELYASPRHPIVDGGTLGSLVVGDELDNSLIVKAERVQSKEAATYDILPSGETGFYWANDILIASTLAPQASSTDTCVRGHLRDRP